MTVSRHVVFASKKVLPLKKDGVPEFDGIPNVGLCLCGRADSDADPEGYEFDAATAPPPPLPGSSFILIMCMFHFCGWFMSPSRRVFTYLNCLWCWETDMIPCCRKSNFHICSWYSNTNKTKSVGVAWLNVVNWFLCNTKLTTTIYIVFKSINILVSFSYYFIHFTFTNKI